MLARSAAVAYLRHLEIGNPDDITRKSIGHHKYDTVHVVKYPYSGLKLTSLALDNSTKN